MDYVEINESLLPALEDRFPKKEFCEDAPHRPNIDGSGLDVSENERRKFAS